MLHGFESLTLSIIHLSDSMFGMPGNDDLVGPITSTVSLGDVDGDGSLDVVVGVSTAEGSGEVWAVSAESGLQLPYFPVKFMNR